MSLSFSLFPLSHSTLICRTETDIRERCDAALHRLLTYPHPILVQAIGESRYRDGTELIFEGLQCKELNKQLFFKLLDIIILELFPELDA